MARLFNGTSDRVTFTAGGTLVTGAYTIAGIFRRASNGDVEWPMLYVHTDSGNVGRLAMELGSTTSGAGVDTFCVSSNSATGESGYNGTGGKIVAADGWVFGGHTRAAGAAQVPRAHVYRYATDAWTQQNHNANAGVGARDNPPSLTGGSAVIGAFRSGATYSDFFDGDVAVIGVWNRVLSDAEMQLLPIGGLAIWHALSPIELFVLDQAAVAQLIRSLTGSGSAQASISGTAVSSGSVPVFGYGAEGLATREAAAGGSNPLAGDIVSASAVMGAVSAGSPLAGSVISASTLTAAATVRGDLAASLTSSSVVAGAISIASPLTGVVASTSSVVGAITVARPLAGAISSTSTVTGDLTNTAPGGVALAGNIASVSAVTAAVTVTAPVAAAVTSTSAVTGTLTATAALAASITSASTITGAVSIASPLAASVASASAVTGDLTVTTLGSNPLAGNITSTSLVAGTLLVTKQLAGAVVSSSSITGDLTSRVSVAASVSSTSVLAGALTIRHPLAGAISSSSTVAGSITVLRLLSGAVIGASAVNGTLTNLGPVTAIGRLEGSASAAFGEGGSSTSSSESSSGVVALIE